MSKMKPEKSRIKSDILLRVRLLYILFILAGLLIFARLVWVQLFSSEVAYNAERLAGRIFTEQIIPAQRGNILTRDGDPLATSIFRYRVEFDFGSPGLDSVRTFHEQSDSLSKLLAAYFGDRSAAEYRRMFRTQHAKHYQVKYRKDTLVPAPKDASPAGSTGFWTGSSCRKNSTIPCATTLPSKSFPATSTTPNGKPCANTRS